MHEIKSDDRALEFVPIVCCVKSDAKKVAEFIDGSCSVKSKSIYYPHRGGNNLLFNPLYDWSILYGDDVIFRLKKDFEWFINPKTRKRFEDLNWRYQRGYLYYGQPGNGKSTAIRIMASHPDISCYSIDFFDRDATNETLTDLIRVATSKAPSLLIFEDLDRVYGKNSTEELRSNISLQHFLNCIDGLVDRTGTIVVATANDPELDSAILKRPGRFDQIVQFKNPTLELRKEFFKYQKQTSISDFEVECLAKESHDFTYAQLKESFVVAVSNTLGEDLDIETPIRFPAILEGIQQTKEYVSNISSYKYDNGRVMEKRSIRLGA